MKDKLYLPAKVKVGYNDRSDTYTKKLGFVIYQDEKNIWKQEKSWNKWRQEKLGLNEYDNIPTEGFVINKNAGGVGGGWSRHSRTEKIRVYDPRGFEIEITIPNLLFILSENASIPGKGLNGEFIYAWDNGGGVILMPCSCEEYKSSLTFTAVQANKFDKNDLKEGAVYQNKQLENLVYMGRHTTYTNNLNYYWDTTFTPNTQYIFWDENETTHLGQNRKAEKGGFVCLANLDSISTLVDAGPVLNYAEIVQKLQNNKYVGKVQSFDSKRRNIPWKKDNYSRNSFGEMSGSVSKWEKESFPRTEKLSGYDIPTLYIETEPGLFRQCSLHKFMDAMPSADPDEYYTKWIVEYFFITSTKSVTLINDELVVKKSSTNPYKNIKFTKDEIDALNWRELEVKDKFGKHHKIA